MSEFIFVLSSELLLSVPDEEQAQRLAELFPQYIYFFADVTTQFN